MLSSHQDGVHGICECGGQRDLCLHVWAKGGLFPQHSLFSSFSGAKDKHTEFRNMYYYYYLSLEAIVSSTGGHNGQDSVSGLQHTLHCSDGDRV